MKFSIVVPTYNNRSELSGCLAALGQLEGLEYEVLVCVDGSTDGTLDWLRSEEFDFTVRVLEHPDGKNHGRSAARNLALPQLKGEYTLFLDSDMQAAPNLLIAHAEVLKRGNHISIGTVRYRNQAENLWVRYTSERGVAKFEALEEVPFHYFITPNTAIKTSWFRGVDGFDPLINRYGGEDMELGYRIHQSFHPTFVYNPAASVFTTQPKTLDEALEQLEEYGSTGLPYIVQKWPDLGSVYWVNKCKSRKLKDRLFEMSTRKGFQKLARGILKFLPYSLQKHAINYLVVSRIHLGYRRALKAKKGA